MEKCCLAGIVKTKEKELRMLVKQTQRSENIPDYEKVPASASQQYGKVAGYGSG